MASIAAAISGNRSATAVGTEASSPFMMRAMSRVGSRSMSASSGRKASVVRDPNWAWRSRESEGEVMVRGGSFSIRGVMSCPRGR
ncbi:hypothetical protein SALBM311S_06258 [Streptomyces alboniger]